MRFFRFLNKWIWLLRLLRNLLENLRVQNFLSNLHSSNLRLLVQLLAVQGEFGRTFNDSGGVEVSCVFRVHVPGKAELGMHVL